MKTEMRSTVRRFFDGDDGVWLTIWLAGLGVLLIWDSLFLNAPAFLQVRKAFLNTMLTCSLVVLFALMLGWGTALLHYYLAARTRLVNLGLTFTLNVLRSVPQIVGILVGYVLLTVFIENDVLRGPISQLLWMSLMISFFLFLEIVDLIGERVQYYEKLDFFQAMLCCGIRESRIINHEILWKNSRAHLLQKTVALFGSALFLQCSIDFIVSVGLSTDVSLSNFPVTLGNMLATIDSKQDILAVGAVLWNPTDLPSLLFRHLQGISVAFLIVFTLLCMYKMSNGIVQRHRL